MMNFEDRYPYLTDRGIEIVTANAQNFIEYCAAALGREATREEILREADEFAAELATQDEYKREDADV